MHSSRVVFVGGSESAFAAGKSVLPPSISILRGKENDSPNSVRTKPISPWRFERVFPAPKSKVVLSEKRVTPFHGRTKTSIVASKQMTPGTRETSPPPPRAERKQLRTAVQYARQAFFEKGLQEQEVRGVKERKVVSRPSRSGEFLRGFFCARMVYQPSSVERNPITGEGIKEPRMGGIRCRTSCVSHSEKSQGIRVFPKPSAVVRNPITGVGVTCWEWFGWK